MADSNLPDDAPATKLFPQFPYQVYEMVSAEVRGLTDAQLDFETDRWEWGKWSIRRNLSHVSSGDVRWLWGRWGSKIFPDGHPNAEELDSIVNTPHDRRLNEDLYWEPEAILGKLWEGLALCRSVLAGETAASLRSKELEEAATSLHGRYRHLFPGGVREAPHDPSRIFITLETTFRHRYFEYTTHLFNIQRLKRAQGLPVRVEIPRQGYWTDESWDRSEP